MSLQYKKYQSTHSHTMRTAGSVEWFQCFSAINPDEPSWGLPGGCRWHVWVWVWVHGDATHQSSFSNSPKTICIISISLLLTHHSSCHLLTYILHSSAHKYLDDYSYSNTVILVTHCTSIFVKTTFLRVWVWCLPAWRKFLDGYYEQY